MSAGSLFYDNRMLAEHSIYMQFSLPCNVPQQLTYLPNCISLLPEVVSHISSMLIGSL